MRNSSIFRNIFLTFFTLAFSLILLTGCGYKPSSYYAKKEISGKVYVDLHVNLEDPKNSVLIKNALNELLINKLESELVYKKELADTIMNITLNSVNFTELSYGEDGYIQLYKGNTNE